MAHTARYWDGESWTGHIAPTSSHAAPRVSSSLLTTTGYALAVLFPVGGLACGLVLIGKGQYRAGAFVSVLSVVMTVVWLYALSLIST